MTDDDTERPIEAAVKIADIKPIDRNSASIERIQEHFKEAFDKAPAFLKDPSILHRIKVEYLDKEIIGEDTNKLVLFTIMATSLTHTPLGALVTGESSAGKSHLANKCSGHFGNVVDYTRMTTASADRSGANFTNKILYIGELHGAEQAQGTLRVLISEGKLKLLTTTRDEETVKLTVEAIETKGTPCFISTTTNVKPDEELLNRLFIISTDLSDAQTRRIIEFEARKYMEFDDLATEYVPERSIWNNLCYAQKYTSDTYRIPYADLIAKIFPITSLKARRDFKKLLALIGASTLIHAFQRPVVFRRSDKSRWYILSLPIDLYIALRIADKSLKQTLLSMEDRIIKTLSLFKSDYDLKMTNSMVGEALNLSESRARQILNALTNAGYLIKDESKKVHIYSLRHGERKELIATKDLSGFFSSWGEKELKSYLTGFDLISLQGDSLPFPKAVIDPLTGDSRTSIGMLQDLVGIKEQEAREAEEAAKIPLASPPSSDSIPLTPQ